MSMPIPAFAGTSLGNQNGGDQPVDPWDLHEQRMLGAIRFQLPVDVLVEHRNIRLGGLEPAKLHRQ
jgi:hypothetical protein